MDAAEIPNLAIAINRWLSYQLLCGREALLSEAYLGQPLAEFLIHRHQGNLQTEVDHPVLNEPGPGRPRQIDYALLRRLTKTIEVAIECKWVSERPYDKQRILNDILRLECVRVEGTYIKRYFVVAGLQDHFDMNFKSLNVSDRTPFTKEFLSFSKGNSLKEVQVRTAKKSLRVFHKRFAKAFNAEVPVSFTTNLLGYRSADAVSVCVWQIGSSKGRSTFDPTTHWPEE